MSEQYPPRDKTDSEGLLMASSSDWPVWVLYRGPQAARATVVFSVITLLVVLLAAATATSVANIGMELVVIVPMMVWAVARWRFMEGQLRWVNSEL